MGRVDSARAHQPGDMEADEMSDCANGGRNVYQRPHETLRMRMEFVGDNQPWMYALALNGREVDCLYLDEVRYVPERTCEMKWTGRYCPPGCMVPQDMVQTCSACGGLGNDPERPFHPDDPNEPVQFVNLPSYIRYCPLCGARIS